MFSPGSKQLQFILNKDYYHQLCNSRIEMNPFRNKIFNLVNRFISLSYFFFRDEKWFTLKRTRKLIESAYAYHILLKKYNKLKSLT